MITDIPSSSDFESVGLELLHLAWNAGISLQQSINFWRDYSDLTQPELDSRIDRFLQRSQTLLATALVNAQQGSVFLIKARIAQVSPFLLVGTPPRDWPSGADRRSTPFSELRIVDAQDLVRLHDAVCSQALDAELVEVFRQLRRKRNVIIHSIDKSLSVQIEDLLVAILTIYKQLGPSDTWTNARRAHLNFNQFQPDDADYEGESPFVEEFSVVPDALSPSAMRKFFGFESKHRRYICPNCALGIADHAYDLSPLTAVLAPNLPDSTSIWCFVCDSTQPVERKACLEPHCKGNVFSVEWLCCLTCRRSTD